MKRIAEIYPRPEWARRINSMATSVGGSKHMVPLDVNEMTATVRQSTGLDDFGESIDGDWHGRLVSLVNSLEQDANLNVVGRLVVRQEILRCLRSRQFLAKRIAEQPAILEEEIREPLIITGTGRSGTSITLELLGLDPNCLAPIAWQTLHPGAPETDPETLREMTECEAELWIDVVPELAAIHELRADLPEECIALQKPSFAGMHWWVLHDIPHWPMDLEAAMRYHKVVLQAVQYQQPGKHWVLKTPTYLPMLDLLFSFYPDAWIILNHRDPLKTIPSGISTLAATRWLRSDDDKLEEIIAMASAGSSDLMVDIHRRRQNGELPNRFIDLHFSELMADPVEAIKAIYQTSGKSFESKHSESITRYLEHKPKGKFGKHNYVLADWGLEESAIREKNRAYMDCYGVKPEQQ